MSSGDTRNHHENDTGNGDENVIDLLPAYVLNALDDDERATVEAALAVSSEMRAEHMRFEQVLDALLVDVSLPEPPAALGSRIEASVAGTVRRPVPIDSRKTKVLAAAAAVLIVVLSGLVAYLLTEVRDLDRELDRLSAASSRPGTDFTQPLVWSPIAAGEGSTEIAGYFCRTADGSVGWIVIEGLHGAEGEIFQLWLVDGDQVVNGGMFATDEEGRGFGVVRVDVPVHTFSQVWITAEPPGGSPQPTGDPDVKAPIV